MAGVSDRSNMPAEPLTVPATSQHGKVVRIDVEAKARLGYPGQTAKDLVGCLNHGTTFVADEVPMGPGGEAPAVLGDARSSPASCWCSSGRPPFFRQRADRGLHTPGNLRSCAVTWARCQP